MKSNRWHRGLRRLALLVVVSTLSSCGGGASGVGISVGLPASYGSMELGMSTTNWVGGPTW